MATPSPEGNKVTYQLIGCPFLCIRVPVTGGKLAQERQARKDKGLEKSCSKFPI